MGLLNLFSSDKPFDTGEFHSIKLRITNELKPYLICNNLSEEASELYYEYVAFLTSIITGAFLKLAYQESKGLSSEDTLVKSIFKTSFEACINFQEKYILRGTIQKDESFSSVNFKRLGDRRELLSFLLVKENDYLKELREGIKTETPFVLTEEEVTDDLIEIDGERLSFTSTIKNYPSFLKDIFCIKIEETSSGISLLDEKDYNINWDGAETFFTNLILEYKAMYNRLKR